MSATYFTAYVRSKDDIEHMLIGELLRVVEVYQQGPEEDLAKALLKAASQIDSERSGELLYKLQRAFEQSGEGISDFAFDGISIEKRGYTHRPTDQVGGYWTFHMQFGSGSFVQIPAVMTFFGEISSKVDMRGYSVYSGADACDVFYRYVRGTVQMKDCDPTGDFKRTEQLLKNGPYAWWHKGLPRAIREGELRSPFETERKNKRQTLVFTGTPLEKTELSVEHLKARKFAVQHAIENHWCYLVVCAKPDKAVVEKAMAARRCAVISETELNWFAC